MVTNPNPAEDADRARDDQPVTDLVSRARNGDKQAWDTLVDRYAPLIWSVCRRYRLDDADADDVGQNVWLSLVIHLSKLRDPAALPGWLVTTTRRECSRALRAAARAPSSAGRIPGTEATPDQQAVTAEQGLLKAEQHAVLREAFSHLPLQGQQLIALLIADPRLSYAQISAKLGIPTGSIGPNRRRYLDKLRSYPAVANLIDSA